MQSQATMNASAGFARLLAREAKPLIPTKAKFHRMASLMVLKAPDIPSILVETAFISNPEEEARLTDEGYQNQMADALMNGIRKYFSKNPPLAKNRLT